MSKYTVDDVIDGEDQPAWFTRRILRYLESIRRSDKPWASLRRVRNEFHRNHQKRGSYRACLKIWQTSGLRRSAQSDAAESLGIPTGS